MPRHRSSRRRRRPSKQRRTIVLVVCGGESTEQSYIEGLRDVAQSKVARVRVKTKPRSPEQVVAHAIKLRDLSPEEVDELWCVFDVDEYAIDPARRLADQKRVRLAISDPCFELWLLLHFENYSAHLKNYAEAARRLKKHVPRYDKSQLEFNDYADGVAAAIQRAEKLGDTGNPSTGMWRLAARIRSEEAQ